MDFQKKCLKEFWTLSVGLSKQLDNCFWKRCFQFWIFKPTYLIQLYHRRTEERQWQQLNAILRINRSTLSLLFFCFIQTQIFASSKQKKITAEARQIAGRENSFRRDKRLSLINKRCIHLTMSDDQQELFSKRQCASPPVADRSVRFSCGPVVKN